MSEYGTTKFINFQFKNIIIDVMFQIGCESVSETMNNYNENNMPGTLIKTQFVNFWNV